MNYLYKPYTNKQYADFIVENQGKKLCSDSEKVWFETIEEKKEINIIIEISELKSKLAASDYAVIKIAEGAATPEEYADLISQRQQWRARINELEASLSNE